MLLNKKPDITGDFLVFVDQDDEKGKTRVACIAMPGSKKYQVCKTCMQS